MALEIFRLVGSVFVDTDKAEKSLHKTDKNAQSVGKNFLDVVKKAGKFGAAVVGAATAAGSAVVALTENTREYRNEQAKLKTAFEASNLSGAAATATYRTLNSVLGDTGAAVEASTHLALLCENEQELAEWTNICTGVYGTFGASLPIESLTEAANETVKVGQVTGALADALNWAGVSEDAFNEKLQKCTSSEEREALVRTTLNGLYSNAADLYRENNEEVIAANAAQDRLNSALAKTGAVLEPVVTKGKELLAAVLEKATPYVETFVTKGIPKLCNGLEKVGKFLGNVVDGFVVGFETITTMWSGLGDFFKLIVNGVVSIFSTIGSAIGNAFKPPLNAIISSINRFISSLNNIKIPDWVPGVGGRSFNISTIPLLEEGAVLERGQTGFLEGNGAEAVVPLHKNKKWISAVAQDMAANGLGGNSGVSDEVHKELLRFLVVLPTILLDALQGVKIEVNDREFGRLVKAVS